MSIVVFLKLSKTTSFDWFALLAACQLIFYCVPNLPTQLLLILSNKILIHSANH